MLKQLGNKYTSLLNCQIKYKVETVDAEELRDTINNTDVSNATHGD